MTISKWMTMGTVLKMHALNYPDKEGAADKSRTMTFKQWNERSCRLGNALGNLGIKKGDRFAILAYNCVEWMEIYAAAAKAGQICVPIMFRLAAPEIKYIVNHAECKGFLVAKEFVETVNSIRDELLIPGENYVYLGNDQPPPGYRHYESLIETASPEEPEVTVDGVDPWTIMYTSGTTGRPKGVVRSHERNVAHYVSNIVNMGIRPDDCTMLVMPMCHVNSIHYSFTYTYVGARCFVYNAPSFDPVDVLKTIDAQKITFTSLVPTHYIMMLALPDEIKKNIDVSSIRQLLISSAPARKETKLAIMEYFKNAELWEAYGSTEAGLVTLLRPEEQFKKLGSIGREVFGTDRIKLLDKNGGEVPRGQVGELYSRAPHAFNEYWKDPERTKSAFKGEWFSAGDMAYQDEDGYYVLVDRRANMIITGGENVFPSEVENALGSHPAVKYVVVIGVPHEKWGEAVKAVVALHQGKAVTDKELIEHCRARIAGYKVPKSIDIIREEDMPMTPTGKILHRVLRDKYGKWSDVR